MLAIITDVIITNKIVSIYNNVNTTPTTHST